MNPMLSRLFAVALALCLAGCASLRPAAGKEKEGAETAPESETRAGAPPGSEAKIGAGAGESRKGEKKSIAEKKAGREHRAGHGARREEIRADENAMVQLDLDNVEIKYVIKLFSDLTGRNFILGDAVRGNVTVMSRTKVPVTRLIPVLGSILETRGLAMAPAGDFITIVPKREAERGPAPVTEDIRAVINRFSARTGKNFVVGSVIRGDVTVCIPSEISADRQMKALETILGTYGIVMAPEGDFIKIVPGPSYTPLPVNERRRHGCCRCGTRVRRPDEEKRTGESRDVGRKGDSKQPDGGPR